MIGLNHTDKPTAKFIFYKISIQRSGNGMNSFPVLREGRIGQEILKRSIKIKIKRAKKARLQLIVPATLTSTIESFNLNCEIKYRTMKSSSVLLKIIYDYINKFFCFIDCSLI